MISASVCQLLTRFLVKFDGLGEVQHSFKLLPNYRKSDDTGLCWLISWRINNSSEILQDIFPLSVYNFSYVVIRIRADNPGLWLIHCHLELHMLDGMTMMLNESFNKQPSPPADFPRCRSFNYDDQRRDPNVEQMTDDNGRFKLPKTVCNHLLMSLTIVLDTKIKSNVIMFIFNEDKWAS